ncbi:hypothetical protein AAF712_016028, partial [Marasmius tenuissimus]
MANTQGVKEFGVVTLIATTIGEFQMVAKETGSTYVSVLYLSGVVPEFIVIRGPPLTIFSTKLQAMGASAIQ